MPSSLEKFQELLRELFQFDCADLDFGIYRIMNHKRDVIERFIVETLPNTVAEELRKGALHEQSQAEKKLREKRNKIWESFGHDAVDADGNLAEMYRSTPLGKDYLEHQAKASGAQGRDALEAAIFNHLYAFFSRYYQDGDFISKRRYSKRHRYAIPYNGEEVHLHWANSDQYYVKTGEHFRNYAFKSRNITVEFDLKSADVEQNNVKSDKRYFAPCNETPTWDEASKRLAVSFEYRPLTSQEKVTYGKSNQQEKIINKAVAEIPNRLKHAGEATAALMAERRKNSDGESVSFFEHHLLQYTRRNTSDFFIHKDLKGFLTRELDFFLKNEVLNLDEMEAAGEERSEGWFQMLRTIRSVGSVIIDFLDQIENFQKLLWEKRKFVTETQYCITIKCIDEVLHREIALCDAQWDEWRELFGIDKEQEVLFNPTKGKLGKRLKFLKLRPTLVLDTRHFSAEFTDRLLGGFVELDKITDGVLIHGENLHALQVLSQKYNERLHCVHIDPPYNTQTSGFLYKNEYEHSSWLAMMYDRIVAALPLLGRDGAFLCHIDENEYEVLHLLFADTGVPDAGTIVWDKKNPMLGRKGIATQHEYILWRTWEESSVYMSPTNIHMMLDKAKSLISEQGCVNEQVRRTFRNWVRNCESLTGGERAYQLVDDDGRVFQSVAMGAPESRADSKFHIPLIHPETGKRCPVPANGWSRAPTTLLKLVEKNEIIFGEDETVQPRRKVFLTGERGRQLSSVVSDARRGKNDIEKLGLEFPYCHPVSLYESLLGAAVPNDGDIIIDHFAGSGTTGHAIINLNREDGRRRRFMLIEMGDHFDTVLLPRIKKITFSPEWKGGIPKRLATDGDAEHSPRIVQYLRIESYEDALNNIDFDEVSQQKALQFDDYMLKYMLRWETKRSETLLNVEKLSNPFAYQLNIHSDGETRKIMADIPETFNYLIGLHVKTRRVHYDEDRRYLVYCGKIDQRLVAVIWRETEDWKKPDFERDRDFVVERKLTVGVDDVYVNGDSLIHEAKALEPLFKRRMFAGVAE
ncbi:MAG: site-specific DNA-methyltransferase [Gemmatimonadota bacterium]|nr:site-specific DNA-methyltransferase [Gemmatimonadota bacterium]